MSVVDSNKLPQAAKRVLIVDDSQVVRKVANRMLTELGFTCDEAGNGLEALRICQSVMPEAILLDWNMPVMDGLEFLGHLRSLENGRMPKVVFCTSENEISQISRAIEAGADEYIMKPFDARIVSSKFEEVGLIPCS